MAAIGMNVAVLVIGMKALEDELLEDEEEEESVVELELEVELEVELELELGLELDGLELEPPRNRF